MGGCQEELFCSTLDAAEEFMTLQLSLGEALRAGFLSLAQARYSMGADRVSALQYPSHMHSTAKLRASESGELVLVTAAPVTSPAAISLSPHTSPQSSPTSTGSWTAAPDEAVGSTGLATSTSMAAAVGAIPASASALASAGVGHATTSDVAAAAAEGGKASLEHQLQRLRLAAQQSDSIVEQLAAKYGCDSSGTTKDGSSSGKDGGCAGTRALGGALDEEYEEVVKPGRPLHWFGSLVAPSLREAEGHFERALALAVQAANAQRRVRQGMDGYSKACQAQGMGPESMSQTG